jgi:hypothetical protein
MAPSLSSEVDWLLSVRQNHNKNRQDWRVAVSVERSI